MFTGITLNEVLPYFNGVMLQHRDKLIDSFNVNISVPVFDMRQYGCTLGCHSSPTTTLHNSGCQPRNTVANEARLLCFLVQRVEVCGSNAGLS
jgi:hypothetical protein